MDLSYLVKSLFGISALALIAFAYWQMKRAKKAQELDS